MFIRPIISFCLIFLFLSFSVYGKSIDEKSIPSQLKPWKSWVLYGNDDKFCPSPFDNGNEYLCVWPSRLELKLTETGGSFSQKLVVYSEGWVPLPGNKNVWPCDLKVNGKDVVVMSRSGKPSIRLKKGSHNVNGAFKWKSIPDMINIPEKTGLVNLAVNNKNVASPLLDNQGRLWLQNKKIEKAVEDSLEVKLFRLVDDDIPMFITTLVRLYVSGQAREIKLSDILPQGFLPMQIDSQLPVLIADKGDVIVQARPGSWDIFIKVRSNGPVNSIGPAKAAYGQEIWSVKTQNHLRMIKIEGVSGIDPGQTDLPGEWKSYPAYIINKDGALVLEETGRGDPSPAPDHLKMTRQIWLDFDGKGYTLQDNISGTMSRKWYLAMNSPVIPGRIVLDGVDQLITGHGKENKPGVELRKGNISLESESRIESDERSINAVGWDHNVQKLSATLNLPPGWKLINVTGVDSVSGTWLQKWNNLIDLFLVLVISTAIFRLFNWKLGILALVTLVLIYHEAGAPRTVWLYLLAAAALLRFIHDGWIKKIIELWRLAAIIVLVILTVPFIVNQARTGFYPQLENASGYSDSLFQSGSRQDVKYAIMRQAEEAVRPERRSLSKIETKTMSFAFSADSEYSYKTQNVMLQDPNALIQTGPGLPQWRWRSHSMSWNGPVDSDQTINLWLISPGMNFVLSFLRIILLIVLFLSVLELKKIKLDGFKNALPALILFCLIVPGAGSVTADEQANFPPPEMLNQLKERLLEKDECFPNCADSPDMEVSISKENVRILFRVHASTETAIPLPGSLMMWNPEEVYIGNKPADNLLSDKKGIKWMLVPEGINDVVIRGKVPAGNEFQVPLTMIPHNVSLKIDGWAAYGIDREGQVQGSIKFVRLEKKSSREASKGSSVLPPFFHVERVISLGIDWQIHTTVKRITPSNEPVVVSIPLVKGESVITAGIKVEDNTTVLSMSPGEREKRWVSTIKPSDKISFKAVDTTEWTETWILDASPIWHCELSGIPLIHHQDSGGQWRPEWRPWQGEEITINITRPMAVPGRVITVDKAELSHTPGKRTSMSELDLSIRSSQGGQQKITLPEGANIRKVTVSGKSQPVKQQERIVTVPLNPGAQTVKLEWQEKTGSLALIKTPAVDIGTEAVNAYVNFNMPGNRWVLFAGGPVMGPAVLFWSYFVVIIIAGIILGRVKWTPLGTVSWILLGLGLTQVPAVTAIIIAGWFLAMGARHKAVSSRKAWVFNLTQILLIIWFLGAMGGLWSSIERGLLGIPNMQIQGNMSSDFFLKWTQDRITNTMPSAWVMSVNIFVFRGLMLLWALWLAYSLILKWLPWAWNCFSGGGIFKKMFQGRKKKTEKEEIIMDPRD